MKVDAPGLVAAAQRLITALEALAGSGVPHPPLAADPASLVAAERLTTAGAELTAALVAHVAALVASLEVLTGAAITYLGTDDQNAAAISALEDGMAGGAAGPGSAPPAPPIPADLRAPMPPPAGMPPKAISVAVHSGGPGDGQAFIGAWSHVAQAARNGSATIRSAVAELPEVLNGPMSTPAVSQHLLNFADGLDTYADRAYTLVNQAKGYASNQIQARADIPTPQELTTSENHVRTLTFANAASGGKHSAALAHAVNVNNRLNEQAMTGYPPYHARADAATAGDDPDTGGQGLPIDPRTGEPAGDRPGLPDPSAADPNAEGPSPEAGGEMASLLPQLLPSLLGAAGGLVGGVMGAVTKVPEALMQAGSQALGAATQGLSGLGQPEMDPPGKPSLSGADPGGAGGGGDAPTTPAAGDGASDLPVAPSTGAPPTPAVAPVGAADGPGASGAPAGASGVTPMGMPMGGLGGAPGGAGGAQAEDGRKRKVVVPDIPHTEDVTGRVDTNRLSAAAAANHRDRSPEPPNDDNSPDSAVPIVRRLVTRAAKEPS
jgi:hypothetical protein